jgi:DNA polymerase-3 subunit beta
MVATDGRRLALVKTDITNQQAIDKKIIVPAKTIQELLRNLKTEGEVKIVFADNQIMFEFNSTIIVSRLIEGEFPNYEQVIPKEVKERLKLDREKFLWATKRAGILATADSQAIKIDLFKNKMVVSKNTPDLGEAREEIDINYSGREFSIGFNPNYLTDVLKSLDSDEIDFELSDAEKPGVIRTKDGSYVYIVLPMQLV